ncbi:hypothetical protein STANM309S_04630 [Streptomyces tanashiensis]
MSSAVARGRGSAGVDLDDVLQALHLPGHGAGGAAAVAELAVDAAAPGVHLAVLQEGEAEVAAGRDLLDLGHALDAVGDRAAVAGAVVAELAVGVVAAEGTVSASGEVTTNLVNDITSENKTPNLKDGPTSTNGTKTSVAAGGKVAGSLSAKLAFEAAFKATYSKSWTIDNTEATTYKTTVKPYDMLVFGASAAMKRVVGNLVTDNGQRILGIRVDSPSMVNSSTFVAQTYAVPDMLCGRKRPAADTQPDNDNNGLRNSAREVPAARAVPPGTDPKREVVLSSHGPD